VAERLDPVKARVSALVQSLRSFDIITIERRDDWKANSLASLINSTLADIFGEGSPDYEEYSIQSLDTLPAGKDAAYSLVEIRRSYQEGIKAATQKLKRLLDEADKKAGAVEEKETRPNAAEAAPPPSPAGQKVSLVTMRARMKRGDSLLAGPDTPVPGKTEADETGCGTASTLGARPVPTTDAETPRPSPAGKKKAGAETVAPAREAILPEYGEGRTKKKPAGAVKEGSFTGREAGESGSDAVFVPESAKERVGEDLAGLLAELEADRDGPEASRVGVCDPSIPEAETVTIIDTAVAMETDGEAVVIPDALPGHGEAPLCPGIEEHVLSEPPPEEGLCGGPAQESLPLEEEAATLIQDEVVLIEDEPEEFAAITSADAGRAEDALKEDEPAEAGVVSGEAAAREWAPADTEAMVEPVAAADKEGPRGDETGLSIGAVEAAFRESPDPDATVLSQETATEHEETDTAAAPATDEAVSVAETGLKEEATGQTPATEEAFEGAGSGEMPGEEALANPDAAQMSEADANAKAPETVEAEPEAGDLQRPSLPPLLASDLAAALPAELATHCPAAVALRTPSLCHGARPFPVSSLLRSVLGNPEVAAILKAAPALREALVLKVARVLHEEALALPAECGSGRTVIAVREKEEHDREIPAAALRLLRTLPRTILDLPDGASTTGERIAPAIEAALAVQTWLASREAAFALPLSREPNQAGLAAREVRKSPLPSAQPILSLFRAIHAVCDTAPALRKASAAKKGFSPRKTTRVLPASFGPNGARLALRKTGSLPATLRLAREGEKGLVTIPEPGEAKSNEAIQPLGPLWTEIMRPDLLLALARELVSLAEKENAEIAGPEAGTDVTDALPLGEPPETILVEEAPGRENAGVPAEVSPEDKEYLSREAAEEEVPEESLSAELEDAIPEAGRETEEEPEEAPSPTTVSKARRAVEAPPEPPADVEENPFAVKRKEQPVRKAATLDEMRAQIAALTERIEEFKSFDVATVKERFDPGVESLRTSANNTLAEIFGRNTQAYWHHSLPSFEASQASGGSAKRSANVLKAAYKTGINKAVAKLEGIVESLKGKLEETKDAKAPESDPGLEETPAKRETTAPPEKQTAKAEPPGKVVETEEEAKKKPVRKSTTKPAEPSKAPAPADVEENPFAVKRKEQPVRKAATLDEMRAQIAALTERIEEFKSFDVATVKERFDPGVESLRTSANNTLAEIFGRNTQAYWHHSLPSFEASQASGGSAKRSANVLKAAYKTGINKAVAKLEGIVESLKAKLEET
jgi:outer membrane biosynthesis protein TonB